MESTLAAAEEGIIASLDYKLPSVASYVESRNESTFFLLEATIFRVQGFAL